MIGFRSKDVRKSARKTMKATGWLRLDSGFAVRQCRVIDISETGARIAVEQQQSVPNAFSFMLDRSRGGRAARIKWRKGAEIGLEFVASSADKA